MSKKIYFKSISEVAIKTMNSIADIIFACTYESKELSKKLSEKKRELEKVKTDITQETDTDKVDILNTTKKQLEKDIELLENKRKATNNYKRYQLFDYKDKEDNAYTGLFSVLKVDKELYDAYEKAFIEGSYADYEAKITTLLTDVLGMNLNEKLTKMLSDDLFRSVGLQLATPKGILRGEFVRIVNKNRFFQLFAMTLIDRVAKTCPSVNIPNSKNYTAAVEYDKNVNVKSIEVLPVQKEDGKVA